MVKSGAKKESSMAWRVLSILIVLGVVGLVMFGGKPILTAFVISDSDYNTQVDKEVTNEIQQSGEARVIIKIKDESGLKAMVLDGASEVAEKITNANYVSDSNNVLSADINTNDLNVLKSNPAILEIKPVRELSLFLQDSTRITNATEVWNYQITNNNITTNITGEGQTICIIDTGVNFSHNDLLGKNALGGTANIDCINENCVANTSVSDDHGHGTFVSGIAVANGNIKGISPGAKIIGIKVLNAQGGGYEDDLKLGMEWCINNSQTYNISVISMSLGTTTLYTTACDNVDDALNLTGTINDAYAKNITLAAATGNTGSSTGIASPACITKATSVGATDKNDAIIFNRNIMTDLLAPGSSINSTTLGGSYSSASGTSMSTPHVSGAFALLQQFYKLNNGTQAEVGLLENALKNTSKTINDTSSGRIYYRINIHSALLSLLGTNTTNNTNQTNQTTPGNETNNTNNQTNITNPEYYITTTLNSPQNNTQIGVSLPITTFSCTGITNYTNATIQTITLKIWNLSNSLLYNEVYNVTNASINSNITKNFTYNISSLTGNSDYYWNCLVSDDYNNSGNSSTSRSITYDISYPQITIISPENNTINTTSGVIQFKFNASDNYGITNCNMTRNGANIGAKGSISNVTNNFFYTLFNGNYYWSIKCYDTAGNVNDSETRLLTVDSANNANSSTTGGTNTTNNTSGSGGSSSGGGGGGGGSEEEEVVTAPTKYSLSSMDAYAGKSYEKLKANDEVKFKINKDGKDVEKTMIISAIGAKTVRVYFAEEKILRTIIMGETSEFRLVYTDKNDTQITVSNILSSRSVDLIIKSLIAPAVQAATTPTTTQNSPTTGNAVKDKDLVPTKNQSSSNTNKLSGFVVGLKENSRYIIALIIIGLGIVGYFVFRRIRMIRISGNSKTVKSDPQVEEIQQSNDTKDKQFLDQQLDEMEKKGKK